jgi:hypothetical protein
LSSLQVIGAADAKQNVRKETATGESISADIAESKWFEPDPTC